MPLFKKAKVVTEAINAAGNIVDNVVTTQQERGLLKNQFSSIISEMHDTMQQQVTTRHKTDMQSKSWLSRNIRGISTLVVLFAYIFAPRLGISPEQQNNLFELNKWVFSFYFGSKVLEQGMPLITTFTKSLKRRG